MSRLRLLALIATVIAPAVPAGAQLQSRTIDLPKVFAQGMFTPVPGRTIQLPPISGDGSDTFTW